MWVANLVVKPLVVGCRVKAGEWLGPWVLCHTLEAVVQRMEPDSLNVHVHVVAQPGGAVPVLYTARSVAVTNPLASCALSCSMACCLQYMCWW